jgi:pimeloyl-ACP methyl ester carboxylesterase
VALLDTIGIERTDFVCNSWGGTIALNLAAKYPDRVGSLVVTGSMPVFHGPLAPLPEGGRRGRNARDVYYGGEGPRGEWQDLTEELGRIQAPVLFMWGMQDAFLTPDYPLMLARMVPNGNLHVMDHASHHLQEERPREFHSVVSGFLDASAAKTAVQA